MDTLSNKGTRRNEYSDMKIMIHTSTYIAMTSVRYLLWSVSIEKQINNFTQSSFSSVRGGGLKKCFESFR